MSETKDSSRLEPTLAGSISHGTLRPQDLVPAFLSALEDYGSEADYDRALDEWLLLNIEDATLAEDDSHEEELKNALLDRRPYYPPDDHPLWSGEQTSYFLNETLWAKLGNVAPDGYYFGSHPGDGSDFGFWPNEF